MIVILQIMHAYHAMFKYDVRRLKCENEGAAYVLTLQTMDVVF